MEAADLVATAAKVRGGNVVLELLDGSSHTFPVYYYPRLAGATPKQLSAVRLRVGGRALRWEALDEDIWVSDAILGRYPSAAFTTTSCDQRATRGDRSKFEAAIAKVPTAPPQRGDE